MKVPGIIDNRVIVTFAEGIANVRMNRPDKRNALDSAMFASLAGVGGFLKKMPDLRAVVLSGEGASFCAGLDFSSFQGMAQGAFGADSKDNPGAKPEDRITHLAQQVCWVWQEVPVPVIAILQGHALGGGMQIALGADIRIAHPDTQLSVREVYWGLVPDMTGTLTLSQLVRPDVAKELVFTARILDAREGRELGLVTRLSDEPAQDAMALAQEIASRSPDAVRGAKGLMNRQAGALAEQQFAAERDEIHRLIGSDNQAEAVRAYFEKRAPVFKD